MEEEIRLISPSSQLHHVRPPQLLSVLPQTNKRLHQPITDLMESRSQDWYQEPIVNITYKLITNQGMSHLREKQVVMKNTKNSNFRSS